MLTIDKQVSYNISNNNSRRFGEDSPDLYRDKTPEIDKISTIRLNSDAPSYSLDNVSVFKDTHVLLLVVLIFNTIIILLGFLHM